MLANRTAQGSHWMNITQVEAFRAVVLTGSTTAAARVLHTSQPNVSRSIGMLEKATGLRLFDRLPGKLVLTDEGQAFFQEVQRTFVGLEHLKESVGRIRRFGTGPLRIAAVSTIALGLLPRAIQRFEQQHPEVELSIHMAHSTVISQLVDSHFCDLGIVSHRPANVAPEAAHRIFDLKGVVLMPSGHRLAVKERIAPHDLEGEKFISVARNDELRKTVDAVFEQAGVQRVMHIETPYSAIICSLVSLGMGICIVNPLVAHDYRNADLIIRPFDPIIPCEGFLIAPKGRPINRLSAAFADVLHAVSAEESAQLHLT